MDFLNGLFLAGAATALVPVIIHLVQRRRVQRIIFGSLRVLRMTSHRMVHRRRFEELILVMLRALALAVLAAAFARPFFHTPAKSRAEGKTFAGEEAALVLIDNSYSMRAEGRLQRAKEQALEVLRELDPSAKVGVAAFSSRFDELCPIGSKMLPAEEAVKGIRQSWRGTNLAMALKQANRVLTRAGRKEAYRRIILLGDFQASSWKQAASDWRLSAGVELRVRNVARKAVPNVFVARVVVPRLVVAGGFVEVISASVRNLTDKRLNDAVVTFRVNGKQKARQSVTNIDPGEEAPVRFRHKFTEPGDVIGSITVHAADDLPDDNVAHFCVHVTPRVHVLLVNADRAEKMVLNDGLFVKTALVPEIDGLASPFDVREIGPEEMKPADLDGVDVVLFVNVSRLPAAMTRAAADKQKEPRAELHSPLGRFLSAGGGIGFLCGSKVVPAQFNRTFDGLAPCKLWRQAMEKGDPAVVINQIDLRHEIFTEFARPHSGDFSLAEFSQYFLVTDSLRAEVPARFSNADAHPALLERTYQRDAEYEKEAAKDSHAEHVRPKGKSILFVSSMDLEWNNLCLKSVFVPFVHQLTKRLCARRTHQLRNFIVADEITYPVPEGTHRAEVRRQAYKPPKPKKPTKAEKADSHQDPEWTKPVELKVRSHRPASAVNFCPEEPGIYELAYEGGPPREAKRAGQGPSKGSARFAVNLDPEEPDLRLLDTRLLLSAVQQDPAAEGERAGRPGAPGSVAAKSAARERMENRQKVWRYLLLGVLVFLALEMLLAGRIGRT